MNEQRLQKLEVLPATKGSLIYVKDDAQAWTERIDEFLARKKMKRDKKKDNWLIKII